MTNGEFLWWLFDGLRPDEVVFTCSKTGNPNEGGYPYAEDFEDPKANNFFAVGAFQRLPDGSVPRRRPMNVSRLFCIVVDDVSTKIPTRDVVGALGRPSWIVRTSPKNYQYGYKLAEPLDDPAKANALVAAVCDRFTADTAGLNRLVRLPIGVNGKPVYGDPPPATFLVDLNSDGPHPTAELLALRLGLDLDAVTDDSSPVGLPSSSVDLTWATKDPVYARLLEEGLVKSDHYTEYPVVHITCPWLASHTGGRDDGAAYIAPTGFKCHHGHCESRTFADLRQHLGLDAKTIDSMLHDHAVDSFVAQAMGTAGSTSDLQSAAPPSSNSAPPPPPLAGSVDRFHRDGRVMTRPEVSGEFPRHWLFENLIAQNSTWMVAGEGGIGKSRLALALAMSAAAGLPLGPFKPTDPNGVRVLMLTQEDDAPEKGHRYTTQLRWLQKHFPAWRDPEVVPRLGRNLFLPEMDTTKGLAENTDFVQEILADQIAHGTFRLTVFDPLIMFFEETDDDGINSASGARKTIRSLMGLNRKIAETRGESFSTMIVHHLSKAGVVYGSVMYENLSRTVLRLSRDEDYSSPTGGKRGTLTISKANGISRAGGEVKMYLETEDAVVHFRGDFERLSRVERVAKALHTIPIPGDPTRAKMVKLLADELQVFGDTVKVRCAAVDAAFREMESMPLSELLALGVEQTDDYFRPIPKSNTEETDHEPD